VVVLLRRIAGNPISRACDSNLRSKTFRTGETQFRQYVTKQNLPWLRNKRLKMLLLGLLLRLTSLSWHIGYRQFSSKFYVPDARTPLHQVLEISNLRIG
jgi:hypothetical protein